MQAVRVALKTFSQLEPLLVDASDEFDNILSQVPQAAHIDQYLANAAQETDRFRAPVAEDEIKAAQKAAVPTNTQKIHKLGSFCFGQNGVRLVQVGASVHLNC